MDDSHPDSHSFIVKIWIEETAAETDQPTWSGHITHVLRGDRRYVRRLDEVPDFIRPYLQELGVRFDVIACGETPWHDEG